jgi:hypothetical protein
VRAQVVVREGTCYLTTPLVLTEMDSGISWTSLPNETAVLSGGAPVDGLEWTTHSGKTMVATLPSSVNASEVDQLYAVGTSTSSRSRSRSRSRSSRNGGGGMRRGGPAGDDAQRLVRARYPNGDSEVDRMPENYDKLGGGVSSSPEWLHAGNMSVRFPGFSRNASIYPWFGHSNDKRWALDYHTENSSSNFARGSSFWQASVGTAAKYNASTFSPRVALWKNVGDIVLHVIHYDWWGNWQWKLKSINTTDQASHAFCLA